MSVTRPRTSNTDFLFRLKGHVTRTVKSGFWPWSFRVHFSRPGALQCPSFYLPSFRARLAQPWSLPLSWSLGLDPVGHGDIGFSCFFLLNQPGCFEAAPPAGPVLETTPLLLPGSAGAPDYCPSLLQDLRAPMELGGGQHWSLIAWESILGPCVDSSRSFIWWALWIIPEFPPAACLMHWHSAGLQISSWEGSVSTGLAFGLNIVLDSQ